jgi:hypothetical protein
MLPFAPRAVRALGLGLGGVALLGYTDLGVVDAEDGLSGDLDLQARNKARLQALIAVARKFRQRAS